MAVRPRVDPLEAALHEFSRQLGAQLASGIEQGLRSALSGSGLGLPVEVSQPAPAASPCRVPGCQREAISKGLCQNHYQKARRLEMRLDGLSHQQLEALAQDRRALRGRR